MLGYTKDDLDRMTNAIHDAKLFYINNTTATYVDRELLVNDLLMAKDFLDGLWAEGYFDNA
jgi:hypothetical protein